MAGDIRLVVESCGSLVGGGTLRLGAYSGTSSGSAKGGTFFPIVMQRWDCLQHAMQHGTHAPAR